MEIDLICWQEDHATWNHVFFVPDAQYLVLLYIFVPLWSGIRREPHLDQQCVGYGDFHSISAASRGFFLGLIPL